MTVESETETHQGYPVEEIETGERVMESPLTGAKYLVMKWVEKGDGQFVALEKEELDE